MSESDLRRDLRLSIDKCVDREQFLDSGRIADEILNDFLEARISNLESMVDCAHRALDDIHASGYSNRDIDEVINKGLNKPT